jgi:hypothetical protein
MSARLDAPMEDQVALAILTQRSPILGWMLPNNAQLYDRYLSFRDVPQAEVGEWKQGFRRFMQKLAVRHGERPVILKSPPHTCRIKLLLELFPDARFVHIHRHPFEVFRSYRRSAPIMANMLQLQIDERPDFDGRIIEQYRRMYDVFFEEKGLIPEGRFVEIGFNDLEREPMEQLEKIYSAVVLTGFEAAAPRLEEYLQSISDYRKSRLPEFDEKLRDRITTTWAPFFEAWGYPS